MGYYSTFSYEIDGAKVNVAKARELERFFGNLENPDVYGFGEVKLVLKGKNLCDIVPVDEEYWGKFYDCELFAEKLSEVLVSGRVFLRFVGEDSHVWGYVVSPKKVKPLVAVMVPLDLANELLERDDVSYIAE